MPVQITLEVLDAFGNLVSTFQAAHNVTARLRRTSDNSIVHQETLRIANGWTSFSFSSTVPLSLALSVDDPNNVLAASPVAPATLDIQHGAIVAYRLAHASVVTAGSLLQVDITAEDRFGNSATSLNANMAIGIAGPVNTAQAIAFASGLASTQLSLQVAGSYRLTLGPNSSDFNVVAASAVRYRLASIASVTVASSALVNLSAVDAFGNIDLTEGRQATLSVSAPAFFLVLGSDSPTTVLQLVQGTAAAQLYSTVPGNFTVAVLDSASTGIASTATSQALFAHGPAVSVAISAVASITVGQTAVVELRAVDLRGNTATSYAGSVMLLLSGSATGGGVKSFVGGVVSVPVQNLRREVVRLSLSAASASPADLSAEHNILFEAGPTVAFVIIDPQDSFVEVAVRVTVYALDEYGNINRADNRSVTLVTSGPVSGAGVVTLAQGVGVASLVSHIPQTINLSLVDSSATGVSVSSSQQLVLVQRPAGVTPNTNQVEVRVSDQDLVFIKALRELGWTASQTYVALDAAAVLDMNANPVDQVPVSAAMRAQYHNADLVPPTITAFSLNLDANTLTLTFSEPVNVSTLIAARLGLQSSASNPIASVSLTGGSIVTVGNPTATVTIGLLNDDANAIKSELDLATSDATTFLFAALAVCRDVAQNDADPILVTNALRVASYIPDLTAPQLISWALFLATGTIELYFSESVLTSTIQPQRLAVQSSGSSDAIHYQLTGGTVAGNNGRNATIRLTTNDINALKGYPTMATSRLDSFLTMQHVYLRAAIVSAAVKDAQGNNAVEILPTNALQAAEYSNDARYVCVRVCVRGNRKTDCHDNWEKVGTKNQGSESDFFLFYFLFLT